jgi:hypothetical protein
VAERLSAAERLALLVAALCHDLEHPVGAKGDGGVCMDAERGRGDVDVHTEGRDVSTCTQRNGEGSIYVHTHTQSEACACTHTTSSNKFP